MSFLYFLAINFCFKLSISIWALYWLKGSNFKKVVGFIIPQILAVSACIFFSVVKIRTRTKMFNDSYLGNFIIKDLKETTTDNNSNSINSTIKKNLNVQLPSFGENV